jgi:hypothetical protein
MQWSHPYGLNAKKITHQGWLHMVELDRPTNGRTCKPFIKRKESKTNQASPLGLILIYLLRLVVIVKISTNPQVVSNIELSIKNVIPHHLNELSLYMATMLETYGCRPKHGTSFHAKMIGLHPHSRIPQNLHYFASKTNSGTLKLWPWT